MPTFGASICMALKQVGMSRVNPGHPTLLALIEAGATLEEFLGAAPRAMQATGDQFAYLLVMVEGQRRRAAATTASIHRGPLPAQETPFERSRRERMAELTGGLVSRQPPRAAATQPETIDAIPPTHRLD